MDNSGSRLGSLDPNTGNVMKMTLKRIIPALAWGLLDSNTGNVMKMTFEWIMPALAGGHWILIQVM